MSLIKRGKYWWIDITAPDGQRIRETTGTEDRALAQEYHDYQKAEQWKISRLGLKPKHLWKEAVVRWLKEQSHKATLGTDVTHLRWMDKFLKDKYLNAIDRDLIDRITEAKRDEGVSNATVNRVLEVLRAILRKAVNEWEWIERAPHIRMLKEPTRRIRYLNHNEAERLIAVLPAHMADMVAFTLATGLRRANVTGMEWSQVDLTRRVAWIHPDQAKARRAIAVPLNAEAVILIRKQLGKHDKYVFSYNGQRIIQTSTKTWYKGLAAVGIENFRWHDLRHTWASWHVQNGTPLFALQELGGWESPEMVQRYAHLSAEHLAPYADKLSVLRGVNVSQYDTIATQSQK